MIFPMKLLLSFSLFLFVLIQVVTSNHNLRKANICWEKCGFKENMSLLREGKYICTESHGYDAAWSPCMINCLQLKRASNQNKCFCDHCKEHDNHKYFCLKPGPDYIAKEDCDKLVCTGKAKYFGAFCAPTPQIRKEIYFDDSENEL